MCWDVESVQWRGFMHTVLVVGTILITPCIFACGWGFVAACYKSRTVTVFIIGLLNRNIFIGFDVTNILAKSIKLGLPRIFSWHPPSHVSGSMSWFGSVCSHDPHRLPLYPVCCYCSPFMYLGQATHILSYLHSTPICLTHSHSFHLFISPIMLSPLCFPFSTHHHCITNTQRAESLPSHSHSSHVTYHRYYKYVDSVAGCSSALLSWEILFPSQVSVQVKDKLEFLGRSLANNPLSSCSDSSLFICNYSGVSGLEYLSLLREDLQFWGTHHNLSRSSSARLVLRGNRIVYQAGSIEVIREQSDPLSGAESLGCEWPWQNPYRTSQVQG